MDYYVAGIPYSAELYHHGIKGQKWGIRRYQNPDGSLTPEGKAKYGTIDNFNRNYKRDAVREGLQRKVQANVNRSAKRGSEYIKQGHTKGRTIGHGVARQAAMQVGALAAASMIASHVGKRVVSGKMGVDSAAGTILIGNNVVSTLLAGATAYNVYKTASKVRDIRNAEKRGTKSNGKKRKK